MTLKDWLPIAISALSLLVAFFTFYLQRRGARELVKVSSGLGFTVSQIQASENHIYVEAANVGERVVTLSSFGLRMPDKQVLSAPFLQQRSQLPHELLPGKNCTMFMPISSAIEAMRKEGYTGTVKLTPQFSAQSGAKFHGKPIKFNIEAWANGA